MNYYDRSIFSMTGSFGEGKRPIKAKSGKRPIKVSERPIKEVKRPIKAMVLVGISVGCSMGCFRALPLCRKRAPLKRPIKGSMIFKPQVLFGGTPNNEDLPIMGIFEKAPHSNLAIRFALRAS